MFNNLRNSINKSLLNNDIAKYFAQIRKFPLLTKEEEAQLAE